MPDKLPECENLTHNANPAGKYANYFQIGHNAFEFLLDFGQLFSGDQTEHLHTRIVTSPRQAKELLILLEKSLGHYETAFGCISTDDSD
jgi:hypothetical protein